MKLSIIVPVYGVEKYILEFAESLLFQLNDDVELIIVNDGTKDKSIEIIKEYIAKNFIDKNIIWLEQENQGQSVARNYGISIAKGKYITFLDPDDIVFEKYLNTILCKLNNEADIIEFNAIAFKRDDRGEKYLEEIILCAKEGFYPDTYESRKSLINSRHWFSWVRVFKKELLDINLFPKGYNFQDMMSLPFLYKEGVQVYGINEILIKYRVHQKSAVSLINEKLVMSALYGINIYREASKTDIIYIGKYVHFIEIYCKYIVKYDKGLSGLFKAIGIVRDFRKLKLKDDSNNKFVGDFYLVYLVLYFFYNLLKRIFE